MSNRNQQDETAFFAPAMALSKWNPFLATMLQGNAEAREVFGTIATEWHGFVSDRLREDMALTQRLTDCRTPDQILAAYTDFWHKAAEDYGREITTMTKLVTGVTRKMALAGQSATDESRANSYPSERAAA